MKREQFVCYLFSTMICLILASCGAPSAASTVAPSNVMQTRTQVAIPTPEPTKAPVEFVGGLSIDIVPLDPHKNVATSQDILEPLIWEPLVAMDSGGNWQGVLAKSWQVSNDGLVWTFGLRKGVRFHNGREMTSDDVVYSFKRILDKATGASMYSVLSNKIESIEAPDAYTVKFTLNGGAGTFLSEIGLNQRCAIMAKESVGASGSIVQPIGTGPFVFESWKPGVEWTAKRFDNYWGEVAKIDRVKFVPLTNDTARFTALQTAEVDWIMAVPPNKATQPVGDVIIDIQHRPNTLRLNFGVNRIPFNDPRMRQAVAYAIDKEAINKAVYFDLGQVHNQPFPTNSFLHLDVPDIYAPPNLDKGKSLVAQSGYPNGVDVTALDLPGGSSALWDLVAAQLKPIGIRVKVEIIEPAQAIARIQKGDFDLLFQTQGSIYHWDRVFGYFEKSSSSNWLVGGYNNDEVARLVEQGRDTADQNTAKQIYTQVLGKLQDDAAAIFVLAEPDIQAWRTWLKEFEPNPVNGFLVGPGLGLNYATLDEKPSHK